MRVRLEATATAKCGRGVYIAILGVDIAILDVDITILGVDIAILDVDIAILSVNIAILGVDIAILGVDIAILGVDIAILGVDIAILRRQEKGWGLQGEVEKGEASRVRRLEAGCRTREFGDTRSHKGHGTPCYKPILGV